MAIRAWEDEQRDFWREFIGVYRDLPELWKVKSDGYKDRHKKEVAYQILVEKLMEIDPRANRASVRARINSLRTAYRRELKKVKASLQTGTEAYVPSLWYFDDFDFLREEVQVQGTSTEETEVEGIQEMDETVVEDNFHRPEQGTSTRKRLRKFEHPPDSDETATKLLSLACDLLERSSSDAQVVARGWAVEYEQLTADQQLYAKKFIDDILFEGRLGNLHRHSITINDAQPITTPKHP